MHHVSRLRLSPALGNTLIVVLLAVPGIVRAQSQCTPIYPPQDGWSVDMCAGDPNITDFMAVVLDGEDQGTAKLVRVYHESEDAQTMPQVAVFSADGFIRLKQNADPDPPIPFGTSFILGPGYWPDAATYHHNPRLSRLEIVTGWASGGPLRLHAEGVNHDFEVSYEMTLPPPRDRQTRLHVVQTHTATTAVTIDPSRRAEAQGFKLVQLSSMFINEAAGCDGGHVDCHDSDAVRFIADDLARHQVALGELTPSGFVFGSPPPLGGTWLDLLHSDDTSWQGNTPNVRIALDEPPVESERTVTPQGFITATTDPNHDNVNFWLHDDGPASESWTAGRSDQVGYWLLAQDDPPDPWADLGLRSGLTFLDFEGTYDCRAVSPAADPPVIATLAPIAGYRDTALQLDYDLGATVDNWAQIRCDFSPQLDLSAFDHLRFAWRGSPGARNSLEVGFIDEIGNLERIFIRGWAFAAHRDWWGQLVVPFDFINPAFNPARVKAFLVSVKNAGEPDVGGAGSLAIDNPGAYNVRSRAVPADFESTEPNPVAAAAASAWLATQQQPSGFLKSWEQETACAAHVYPQALALLVFAHEGRWTEADAVVGALVGAQNANGSWFQSYDCDLQPLTPNQWEGDVAWAVYALSRYLARGGAHPEAAAARDRAADWLTGRINPADGCLVIDHTEGTIDAWWALDAAGPSYAAAAAGLESCLLDEYWDEQMGRFKGGRQWWQPYLDNQTWGAAFLHAVGRSEDARRALSYAWEVLRLPAQSGQLVGLDGQGGPWSIWNEGIGQYVAAGGFDAENLVQELLAQQRPDGAVIGAPDHFLGGGVWTPRWYGVAPTAWLYFALTGGPFGCVGGAETLCLNHQRFEVRAAWRNFRGETGSGRAVRLTGDTGYFWFFNRDNVEMVIKVLDACGLNERFWVFAGGLTNVEVEITVTDTSTGAETTYVNPQGTPFQPIQDTAAFATCPSGAKGSGVRRARSAVSEPAFGEASFAGCVPTATTLCLNDDRFQVEVDWEAPGGSTGLGRAESLTSDTGYLWFFNRDNVEMVIKVLDACAVNGRFWVFAGGLTNVEVGIAVTDTATGVAATYVNPQGTAFQPIQDTATFATCLSASFAGSETKNLTLHND